MQANFWSLSVFNYGLGGHCWWEAIQCVGDIDHCQNHGGYPGNPNVRYASHNMADAQRDKNRHVYFSIKTAFNKMI